eukprot:gene4894-34660_t
MIVSAGCSGTAPKKKQNVFQRLQSVGVAGVVAYGLLNTLYYSLAFTIAWTTVAKVPSGQGISATAAAFAKVMATVWAGSQITKAARAAGALFLAPVIDTFLDKVASTLKLKGGKKQAVVIIITSCLVFAAGLFSSLILAWA